MRASAYLPRATDGARRLGAWDEDAFTMAATAIELALGSGGLSGPVGGLRPIADAAGVPHDLWPGVLGGPVRPVPASTRGPSPLAAALADARSGSGPELVVGAVLAGEDGTAGVPLPGEGAFALVVDDVAEADIGVPGSGLAPAPGHELEELFALARLRRRGDAARWPGDWDADPSAGAAAPGIRRRPARLGGSEGAFLPLPSYREGFESRWRLVAEGCARCGGTTFPARGRCRHCGRSDGLARRSLLGEVGRVTAATWIGAGGQPTEFDDQVETTGPYGVALVEFPGPAVATMPLTDAARGEVRVGDAVSTSLRRLYSIEGGWRYGRKASPRRRA